MGSSLIYSPYAALPPDVRKGSAFPKVAPFYSVRRGVAAPDRKKRRESRTERRSLSAHLAAEPQNSLERNVSSYLLSTRKFSRPLPQENAPRLALSPREFKQMPCHLSKQPERISFSRILRQSSAVVRLLNLDSCTNRANFSPTKHTKDTKKATRCYARRPK